ncbi:EI24 domain-containing protein [Aquibaculum arenosum]|uniref:EI24 domain-containing protein n=1 Tax=Aquibaculum arenosum TaxID=3032591 RepID=A0ABT5YNF6_9PROT|nr:EI24 domain-containing protein [Fodinicurvata sp. CAU 1616]MDF2096510.1 EI24 domain-containing protein [Fodinicurvata sp. CAU 1616]
MLSDLMRAFGQLSDPAARRVLWQALGLSLLTFGLLWVGATLGLSWLGEGLVGWAQARGWEGFWLETIEWIYAAAAISGVLVTTFLLFPAVAVLMMTLLLDPICEAVERRWYPQLPEGRSQPWREMLWDAARLTGVTVAVNLVALPLYLILLFFPPFNLFVFYGVNGYLLGREYFEVAGVRRLDSGEVRALRRRNRGSVFAAGVIIALLFTVPLVNLVMPIVATAFMVHRFQTLRVRERSGDGGVGL